MKTVGISPKVWAPVALQVIVFVVNLIASGEFDRTEVAQLTGVALTAVVGYLAGPGVVGESATVGIGSDERLPPQVHKQIRAEK